MQTEWAYVRGTAQAKPGCTPGTRDANNHGKTADDFLALGNDFIRARRSVGVGVNMPESHAYLTLDEVLAVRLYSGPAYQPINTFLRQVRVAAACHSNTDRGGTGARRLRRYRP